MNRDDLFVPTPLPEALTSVARTGRTLVMGIVNVTPDSFSDGGRYASVDNAVAHALALCDEGADMVDIGGESTRPNSVRVTSEQELSRISEVVCALVEHGVSVSVDTIHADTALAMVQAGAVLINDVSGGLADPRMGAVIAETGVAYVCQHWRGHPGIMDQLTDYGGDVVGVVIDELRARCEALCADGVAQEQIIVDPGLGFAKTNAQSWSLLAATAEIRRRMKRPVLVGTSRKRFLAQACDPRHADVATARDGVTAATSALAATAGAWAVRVHDVASTRDAVMTASLWKDSR